MSKTTTVERRPEAEAIATEAPTCQHHWVIDSPRGAMSQGRCKRCGEEREFRNSATDHLWEDESSSGYNAWRGIRSRPSVGDDDEIAAKPTSAREPALIV